MNAIILAGGEADNKAGFQGNKALILLKGIPMIQYVVNALRSSHIIDKLLVVGSIEELQPIIGDDVDFIVEDQKDIMDNIIYALSYFPSKDNVLVATCDVPLLKGEMVAEFIIKGIDLKADIVYPIAERGNCSRSYPDVKRTYAALIEGDFTGGNLFIIAPNSLDKLVAIGRQMIGNRKNPLKMCSYLGVGIIYKYLLKKLSIFELEDYINRRFNVEAKAFICNMPEICHDLDRLEDIELFEKYL